MSGNISQFLGTTQPNIEHAKTYEAISTIYNKMAVLLVDSVNVFTDMLMQIPLPLPLLGFEYNFDGNIELLRYQWGEYPYLNRQLLAYGAIKENPTFTVKLHKVISSFNPFETHFVTNELFIRALEYYIDLGGTFWVLTPWGTREYCVVESVGGEVNEGGQVGITFAITFKKLNFITNIAEKTTSSIIKSISMGIPIV